MDDITRVQISSRNFAENSILVSSETTSSALGTGALYVRPKIRAELAVSSPYARGGAVGSKGEMMRRLFGASLMILAPVATNARTVTSSSPAAGGMARLQTVPIAQERPTNQVKPAKQALAIANGAPANPVDGDCWSQTSGLFCQFNGIIYGPYLAPTHGGNFLAFGDLYGTPYDGVSTGQAYFGQTQATFLPNGSLGALYGQRVATFSGGAPDWAHATVNAAVRGYDQIAATVGIVNEAGGAFVTDNFSNIAAGIGVAGTGFSRNGGPTWGAVLEGVERPRSYTATAGQTAFNVPGGFASIALVTKNGAALAAGAQYTVATPNVTLTVGASAGDIINVYPADPLQGTVGTEIDITAGYGTDNANTFAGNREGLAIVARRNDRSFNLLTHVGSAFVISCSPDDPTYLICDRGVNFDGQLATGIDFTATDAKFSDYLLKFNRSGAGVSAAGNLSIGNLGTNDVAGFGVIVLGNTTNGALLRFGDGTAMGRMSGNVATGVDFGSETNTDVVFMRNGNEAARINANGLQATKPLRLNPTTFSALPGCGSGTHGTVAFITDASAPIVAWHQQVNAGGGSNKAFIACNGSGWFAFDY